MGKIAYEFTAIMLLLNNIFLIGFHVFTVAKSEQPRQLSLTSVFNTLSNNGACTVVFQAVTAILGSEFQVDGSTTDSAKCSHRVDAADIKPRFTHVDRFRRFNGNRHHPLSDLCRD